MTRPERVPLAVTPTPLHRLERLQQQWGCGPLWIKRDDLTGLGVAGNKARPLEYLLADALAQGADILVATGAPTSNFCAAAALVARMAGLDCVIVHPGAQPEALPLPARLSHTSGAQLVFRPDLVRDQLDEAVHAHATMLSAQGRRPYVLPRGGATAIGAVGFASAAAELVEQCAAAGIDRVTVVLPTGSGCSQAGLVAGIAALRADASVGVTPAGMTMVRVVGASVSRPVSGMRGTVLRLARGCARLLGAPEPTPADVDVRDMVRSGFGVTDRTESAVISQVLHHEGLLLDHSYGGKAMLLAEQLATAAERDDTVIYWHTGGIAEALTGLAQLDAATATTGDARPAEPLTGTGSTP